MAYDGDYRSMSDAEKRQTVEGIRDYYRRLHDREKPGFREAMAKTFDVSPRTVYRYLKQNGTDFLGKKSLNKSSTADKDARARFSNGVLQPPIRKGVPKKSVELQKKDGSTDWNKFKKTLQNDGIWKNLNGRVRFFITPNMGFVPSVEFEVYLGDDEGEEEYL